MSRWTSPVGPFDVENGPHGVSSVRPASGEDAPPIDSDLADRLDQHVAGKPAQLKLDLQGLHPLAQVTLAKVLEIPFGEVRNQAWVAREIGRPGASRAVAAAIADNPLPVLVPTHRVIGNDGSFPKAAGANGLDASLHEFESFDLVLLEELAAAGVRFLADGQSFHVATCHKLGSSERIRRLTSVDQAHEAHLRSCVACRPI